MCGPRLLLANALIYPIPDFHHATPDEVAAWGVCMGLAALLAGGFLVWPRRRLLRRGWLLATAAGLFFAGCVFSSRDHGQQAAERVAKSRSADPR